VEVKQILKDTEHKMEHSVEVLRKELSGNPGGSLWCHGTAQSGGKYRYAGWTDDNCPTVGQTDRRRYCPGDSKLRFRAYAEHRRDRDSHPHTLVDRGSPSRLRQDDKKDRRRL